MTIMERYGCYSEKFSDSMTGSSIEILQTPDGFFWLDAEPARPSIRLDKKNVEGMIALLQRIHKVMITGKGETQ